MTPDEAQRVIREVLHRVVPDADAASLAPGENLRDELGLDSLDFLSFVEQLSERFGQRIEEDDYEQLTTIEDAVRFLVRQPA